MKNLITRIALFVLKFFGVTLNDLVAYRKNQTKTKESSKNQENVTSAQKLPLEVLYDGGYRSFFFEADKIPVAIIVGNIGVAFEDCPQEMNWYDANKFCEKYSVGGKKWKLPNYESGHLKVLYENKVSINEVLTAFGKKCLKEDWYWASEYSNYNAWKLNLSDGSVYYLIKGYFNFYVRPVLAV